MISIVWIPQIDSEACIGCGDCVTACPTNALALSDSIVIVGEPSACDYCSVCEMICPVEAISLPYQIVLAKDL